MLTTVILAVVAFLVGGALSYGFFKYGLKSKYESIIKKAETEAEVIKKNKLLEVKEKFLNKKADLEKGPEEFKEQFHGFYAPFRR